jgi:hypothetical protein
LIGLEPVPVFGRQTSPCAFCRNAIATRNGPALFCRRLLPSLLRLELHPGCLVPGASVLPADPQALHDHGQGEFIVAGKSISLRDTFKAQDM